MQAILLASQVPAEFEKHPFDPAITGTLTRDVNCCNPQKIA
jgi:hypothetical protein